MVSITLARWHIAVMIYVVAVGAILFTRPAIMFDGEGRPKSWSAETPFSIEFVFPLLAILCFYIALLVDATFA